MSVIKVIRSAAFDRWMRDLQDSQAADRITARILRIETTGNLGDTRQVGAEVSEVRIHHRPGYRLYFIRSGDDVIVLLCGGDKSSQRRDIKRAKRMATEWRETNA